MGIENYLQISRDTVQRWMQALVAGVDTRETHHYLKAPGYTWTVWELAQVANANFDFSTGDADPDIVEVAREVMGSEAPLRTPEDCDTDTEDH